MARNLFTRFWRHGLREVARSAGFQSSMGLNAHTRRPAGHVGKHQMKKRGKEAFVRDFVAAWSKVMNLDRNVLA